MTSELLTYAVRQRITTADLTTPTTRAQCAHDCCELVISAYAAPLLEHALYIAEATRIDPDQTLAVITSELAKAPKKWLGEYPRRGMP